MSSGRAGAAAAQPPAARRVLLIEDDTDIAEAIAYPLAKEGLDVRVAPSGEAGLEQAQGGADLILLDVNLPGIDGLEVCRLLRRQPATAQTPIIIVSARSEEVDRVLGLELGADDYVVKPFSLKELVARCRAALRRAQAGAEEAERYQDANFEIDFAAYLVRYRGAEVRLTHREFDLLRCLVERSGRVVTRERLLEYATDHVRDVDLRSVDAHVRRLRGKLGAGRRHIETHTGLGYRFVTSPLPAEGRFPASPYTRRSSP